MIPRKLRHIECCFDRLVQLLDLGGVACTHQPLQSLTRNSEDVVQVRHTATRQSLLTTEHHFGRKLTDGSCDKRNDDRTDGGENGVAGEDNHRSVANWRRQLSPPDFSALHASSAFQLETGGSSSSSATCASATWVASRSVIAAASRYWRIASSMTARTSRPCFAARPRSCSSTLPGSSMLTPSLYSDTGMASSDGNQPSRTSGSSGPLEKRGRLSARRSA